MPVVKIEDINKDSCWGLWKIEETTDSLQNLSFLSKEELNDSIESMSSAENNNFIIKKSKKKK